MGIPNFIKASFLKSFLSNLAKSNDHKTTILGAIAAALIATQIDYGKLFQADPTEIGKAVGVIVTALLGYYTNKADAKPSGTGTEVPKSNPQA